MTMPTKAHLRRIAVRRLLVYGEMSNEAYARFSAHRAASETGEHCAHVAAHGEREFIKLNRWVVEAREEAKALDLIA